MAKLQVPSNAETIGREGRRWPFLLVLIVISLLVATGVALGGRWVYREFVEEEPTGTPVELQGGEAQPEATEQQQQSTEGAGSTEAEQGDTQTEPLPDTGG